MIKFSKSRDRNGKLQIKIDADLDVSWLIIVVVLGLIAWLITNAVGSK